MRSDIGIDLGTDTTRVFMGKSIMLTQPTVITIDNLPANPKPLGNKPMK